MVNLGHLASHLVLDPPDPCQDHAAAHCLQTCVCYYLHIWGLGACWILGNFDNFVSIVSFSNFFNFCSFCFGSFGILGNWINFGISF